MGKPCERSSISLRRLCAAQLRGRYVFSGLYEQRFLELRSAQLVQLYLAALCLWWYNVALNCKNPRFQWASHICMFSKHVLSTYYVPDPGLGTLPSVM